MTATTEKLYSTIPVSSDWINKSYQHTRILEIIVNGIARNHMDRCWILTDSYIESINNPKDRAAVKEMLDYIIDEISSINEGEQ